MLKKKWYAVLGAAGALALLLGGVGVAYAQGPQPPLGDRFSPDGGLFGGRMRGAGTFDGDAFGAAPMRGGPFQGRVGTPLVELTAELTGLSEDEVTEALEDGQTFAEIAEAEGVDPQEIVDAAVAEAEARLQEAVDAGRLTEEQMERMLERLTEALPERLEQPCPARQAGGVFGQFHEAFWTMYDAVAEALGLTPEELFGELHGGKSVAEVAEEQGVELEAIHEALEEARVEARKQAIEQAVENGRLTQEQADWMVEGLEQGFVPGGRGPGRGRGFRPGHRGHRGAGMGW